MAIFTFFKLNKHKEFSYTPLFYDKEKEEFNERVNRIKEELGIENSIEFKTNIRRGTMRHNVQETKRQNRSSSVRLIIIIVLLLALAYLFLFR